MLLSYNNLKLSFNKFIMKLYISDYQFFKNRIQKTEVI